MQPSFLRKAGRQAQGVNGLGRRMAIGAFLVCGVFVQMISAAHASGAVVFEITGPFIDDSPPWGLGDEANVSRILQKYAPVENQEVCTVFHRVAKMGSGAGEDVVLSVFESDTPKISGPSVGISVVAANTLPDDTSTETAFGFTPCINLVQGRTYWFHWVNQGPVQTLGATTYKSAYRDSDEYPNSSFWRYQSLLYFNPSGIVEYPDREWSFRLEGPEEPPISPDPRVEISDGSVRALYHLENTNDSSGNGYHLTNSGAAFGGGRLGNAVDVGANNISKTLTYSGNLSYTGGAYSIAGWINPQQLDFAGAYYLKLIDSSTSNTELNIAYDQSAHNLEFSRRRYGSGGGFDQYLHPITLTHGTWYFVALTYNGNNVIAYLNGSAVGSVSSTASGSAAPSSQVYIFGPDGARAAGKMDEWVFSSKALSVQEISNLYNNGAGKEVCVTVGCGSGVVTAPAVTNLAQYELDGTTAIPEGGTAAKPTVKLSAQVTAAPGKMVRLEVDLAKEPGPLFLGADASSTLVAAGEVATVTYQQLSDGDYDWLARAVDEDGNASDWVSFGTAVVPDFKIRREPVIIVPGIMGSELYNGSDLIWADLSQMFTDINDQFITENISLDVFGSSTLPIAIGNVIERIPEAPIVDTNIFEDFRKSLESAGYVADQSFFYFPYDWRLNLDSTKDLLHQKIEAVKTQTGFSKVSIVAHSMGGLLTKNYIHQYGKGSIDKLVFVGTPHLGAPKAAKVLLEGDRFNIPWLEEDRIQEIAENSPAVYELLPSQPYFDAFQGYIRPWSLFGGSFYDYAHTKDFLVNDKGLNGTVFGQAESFFSKQLQNIDLSGIDIYNFAGCKLATQAGYNLTLIGSDISPFMGYTSGDGTVPLPSSDYIDLQQNKKFYVKNIDHSEIPSEQVVRDAIVSILSDQPIFIVGDGLSHDQSTCHFIGKSLAWFSPVDVHIYDAQNRHTGPIENNGIEYGVPGVDYEIIGHEKAVFLPTDENQTYRIEARGTANGTFDLRISENNNGTVIGTSVFNDIPVTTSTTIMANVFATSSDDFIAVDQHTGTGPQITHAVAQLTGEQGGDLTPPLTTSTITGTQGQPGSYRSNISIALTATDPIIPGHESETSGILGTKYSLDGGAYAAYTSPISVSTEGIHTLSFFSTDKAGNNELPRTIQFTIDKTAPELAAQFSTSTKKFVFFSTDNLATSTTPVCTETKCTVQDKAGNITILQFEKDHDDDKYELEFEKISYNGIQKTFPDNNLDVEYDTDNGKIDDFDQEFELNDKDILIIEYDKDRKRSTISTRQPNGTYLKEVVAGVRILRVQTLNGKLVGAVQ